MTFEKDQPVIVHHMDGRGQPLRLEGKIWKQADNAQYWVNVGPVAILVDEKIIEEKGNAKQVNEAEKVHGSGGA